MFRVLLFLLYLAALIYIMFFSERLGRTLVRPDYSYNLVPFREIGRYIRLRDVFGPWIVFWNLAGNVICFLPLGLLMPWVCRTFSRWYRVALLALFVSLLIESAQLILRVGSFDVDDLFLNTVGGILGYALGALKRRFRRRKGRTGHGLV